MAGAEVVDRDVDAVTSDGADLTGHHRWVLHQGALGELEHETVPGQAHGGQHGSHPVRKFLVEELVR